MTRAIFIFIASILLVLPVLFNAGEISTAQQLVICTPFILLFGIPHGAIDDVLYSRKAQNKSKFISIYLVFVGLNVLLWFLLPMAAYILFLFLSAYHFGQSQFTQYFDQKLLKYKALYFFWGISILSGLTYFNHDEIRLIMSQYEEFAVFSQLHHETLLWYVFLISTVTTVFLMLLFTFTKSLKSEAFIMETLVLTLIMACFYLMPLLIGFTLYFVILHSFKVLREEYNFLNMGSKSHPLFNFIKMVAPFTLFSIAGIALLFAMIYLELLSISYGYVLLIIISSITLPHVFVMERFYNLFFKKRFSS